MTIECYRNAFIASSYAEGIWESGEIFTGIIIDDTVTKKAIKFPFDAHVYSDNKIAFKSNIDGRTYVIDPDDVTTHNTRQKLLSYVFNCIETDYYEEFIASGDEVTLNYNLTDFALWTTDSINDSIKVVMQGGILAYYSPAAFVVGVNNQFQILSGNRIKFRLTQAGRRIQVQIKNRFRYV